MKNILLIFAILFSFSAYSQKVLKETTGLKRAHQIESFKVDTVESEIGLELVYKVKINVIREGIADTYYKVINEDVYLDNDFTIEFLSKETEYLNFKIVDL